MQWSAGYLGTPFLIKKHIKEKQQNLFFMTWTETLSNVKNEIKQMK